MNGKTIMEALTFIDSKFLEEAEAAVQTPPRRARPGLPRKAFLIAAVIALSLLLVGCGTVVYRLVLAGEPWASIPEVAGTDVPREDVQITAYSAYPAGIQIQCDITGFSTEEKSIIMLQNAPCILEKQGEAGWEALPKLLGDPEWKADRMITDGHCRVETNWASVYGYLDVGIYRITLEILEDHEPFTLEFEITEEMRTEGLKTTEDLRSQEYWHVRESGSHSFGSLENIPEEIHHQFQGPFGDEDDVYEYWKFGSDMLCLFYDEGMLESGMLYKDGVKYKLEREWESDDAPIVGWMPWPDLDLNRLSRWATYFGDERYQQELVYREDGSMEKAVLTMTTNDGGYDVETTSVRVFEFPDTAPEDIAKMLADQNTNVWQDFSWEEDRQKYKALDVKFVNTTPSPITTAADALALAEKECTVDDNQIKVYRDAEAGIWKIEYQIMYGHIGYQFVYLNDDGLTVMVSGAGSKVEALKEEYPDP